MKKIFLTVIVVGVIGGATGLYFYFKTPSDTSDLKEDYAITASELVTEFESNETLATQKYSDKILMITGEIAEIKADINPTIQLAGSDPLSGVTCSFYQNELPTIQSLKIGDKIMVKGKCTGKLMDVVLNNCRIQKPKQ